MADKLRKQIPGIGEVLHRGPGPGPDVVTEHGCHFMRVAGAADVTQQRDPIHGGALVAAEPETLGHTVGDDSAAQLGTQRLTERVVLSQREQADHLGKARRHAANLLDQLRRVKWLTA